MSVSKAENGNLGETKAVKKAFNPQILSFF
jgi:hypothetical protein